MIEPRSTAQGGGETTGLPPRGAVAGPPEVAVDQQLVGPVARHSSHNAGSSLLVLASFVGVAGVTFAVGRMTAASAAGGVASLGTTSGSVGSGAMPSGAPGAVPSGAAGGIGPACAGSMTIQGTVTGVTSDTLTVKLASGSTVEIPLNASTTYHQQASGSKDAVSVGSSVVVTLGRQATSGSAVASPSASGLPSLGTASDVTVAAQ